MYHYVRPRADGTIYHLTLGGRDLAHSFVQFASHWWTAGDHTRSTGVWHQAALVARVLTVLNSQMGEVEPFLQVPFP